ILLTGGHIVNVFTHEILPLNIAIQNGLIAGIGKSYAAGNTVIDVSGQVILPGLIDAHLHIESTLLIPVEFARAVLCHGTTAVVADPHEIANVLGEEGVSFMLSSTSGLPLDFFFTVPSCVPATDMETAGGEIDAATVERLLQHPRVVGLAEVMNYPGVISGDRTLMQKIAAARNAGKMLDGHAPLLSGLELQAYLSCGISTDHECTTVAEALEKTKGGMNIIIRQGSAAKNLAHLLPAVTKANMHSFMLGSDDKEAAALLSDGHMNAILRQAVALGANPVLAIQMATLNPARHYRLWGRGALVPGYRADLVVVDNLTRFNAALVIKDGQIIVRDGKLEVPLKAPAPGLNYLKTINLTRALQPEDFYVIHGPGPVPVIGIISGQITTEKLFIEPLRTADGEIMADPARDLLKLAVVERHRGSGRIGHGLVRGLGLKSGAIASSVAHDAHNIIVAGVEATVMAAAVNALAEIGGGFVVVDKSGKVCAELPLPVAGIMSLETAGVVAERLEMVTAAARTLGALPEQPFLTLSFLALPVIPHLKLTDRGLVDVDAFCFLS
ncbi:MAG TPA: adenine deaminase, partial [Candidatus Limnocylindrales bacterium]|nr:adenine deaminase [Candidatus Limnocylindrales bacterium]